jgi:hypothetical protein
MIILVVTTVIYFKIKTTRIYPVLVLTIQYCPLNYSSVTHRMQHTIGNSSAPKQIHVPFDSAGRDREPRGPEGPTQQRIAAPGYPPRSQTGRPRYVPPSSPDDVAAAPQLWHSTALCSPRSPYFWSPSLPLRLPQQPKFYSTTTSTFNFTRDPQNLKKG